MQRAYSGVYQIVNRISGKRYIGSAVNIRSRCDGHRSRLTKGTHHNSHLQSAWLKYGREAFAFRTLLICDRQNLIYYEQRAISGLVPEYNVCRTAGSTLGVKLADETRAKITDKARGRKRSPESVEAGAAKLRGRRLSPERAAQLIGNKRAAGHAHTEEWKRRISELNTGRKRPKSPEYRAKIATALKGIPHSPERRATQAAAQRGLKRGPYRRRVQP